MLQRFSKAAFCIAIGAFLSGCATTIEQGLKDLVQKPEVNYSSVALGDVTSNAIEIKPVFNINNPNSVTFPVDAISYSLSFNNKQMLEGTTESLGMLPANGSKDVTVPLKLTTESLSALQGLLFKDKKLDYQVEGNVKVLGFSIPFKNQNTLYMPNISLAGIDVKQASFDNMELVVNLNLDNKNSFDLPLDDINYTVSTGGKSLFKGELSNKQVAQGKSQLSLPLSIAPNQLFGSVFELLRNPNIPLQIDVNSPLFSTSKQQSLNIAELLK